MHSFPEGAPTLFKWQVTSSKAAAFIPYETSLQFQKHEGCILALNFSLPHEAKSETKACCDSWTCWGRHGGGWSRTSLSLPQQAAGCGLSGLPAGTCQLHYEWSLLAVFSDSASAVKQMLLYSITVFGDTGSLVLVCGVAELWDWGWGTCLSSLQVWVGGTL